MRLARVRDSAIPASVPRLRAAWPEVAVPSTWWPERSKASATARSMVVLPAPATPTTSSAPRPEVQMPSTADRCSSDSPAPMDSSAPAMAPSMASGEATGPSVRANWRARLSAMALSRASTEASEWAPFPRPGHADQGDDLGVGQGPVHQALEHLGALAEDVRGQGHDEVPAGEDLAPGQVALGTEHV